jgi:hypothetical protein
MTQSDNATTMLVREFERALRLAQEEEIARMRNVIRGLESDAREFAQILRDEVAALRAEVQTWRLPLEAVQEKDR